MAPVRILHPAEAMKYLLLALALALAACSTSTSQEKAPAAGGPQAAPPADGGRGRLLYDTACLECHTTQAHWRDKSIVHDWDGLVAQVTRWQAIAGQRWSAEEIRDVSHYLNRRFYRLPAPERS